MVYWTMYGGEDELWDIFDKAGDAEKNLLFPLQVMTWVWLKTKKAKVFVFGLWCCGI